MEASTPPPHTHKHTLSPQFHCGTPAHTSETISQFTGADRPRKAQLGWARLIKMFFFFSFCHNLPLSPSTSSQSPFSSHHIKSYCLDALQWGGGGFRWPSGGGWSCQWGQPSIFSPFESRIYKRTEFSREGMCGDAEWRGFTQAPFQERDRGGKEGEDSTLSMIAPS